MNEIFVETRTSVTCLLGVEQGVDVFFAGVKGVRDLVQMCRKLWRFRRCSSWTRCTCPVPVIMQRRAGIP